jgi:hypothetical protein
MSQNDKAADLLVFYMAKAWESAGLTWQGDNDSEVRAIVDLIVDACTKAPDAARQTRYVLADGGKYREHVITTVRTVGGSAVYEGSNGVTGPVFEGPAHLAVAYARTRHDDLTAKGYVVVRDSSPR